MIKDFDSLGDFVPSDFEYEGKAKRVYTKGEGPAVIVMHEMPGITPEVANFSRRVVDEGFKVYMPVLFGVPGKPFSGAYIGGQILRGCISREFTAFAKDEASPVTEWLRALARQAHKDCGGPGVGAVGMCFTGGFALAMMIDACVKAPVLSQPSLPFALSRAHRRSVGLSAEQLTKVKERAADGAGVLGLRFTCDKMSPPERFETLRRELGDNFVGVEIDSSAGNPYRNKENAHCVLTNDLQDTEGHPTRDALEKVLTLFRERLKP